MSPPAPALHPQHVLAPGTALCGGAYVVQDVLGQGGYGITYLGTDLRLQCPVAIKEYFPAGCARRERDVLPAGGWSARNYEAGRQRFLQEGQMLARFNHAGIVRVFAAFEENATTYIVMEYLRGHNFEQMAEAQGGRLTEADALAVLVPAAEALAHVHAAGLLHRDISPANLFRTDEGRSVLIDFGSAKEYLMGVSRTESVTLTPGYAALEQYTRQVPRGPFTDVYSLAAVLHHLVSGDVPMPATDRALGVPLRDVRDAVPEVSATVAAAIREAMAVEISQRPQSVEAFLALLRGGAAPETPAAQAPPLERKPPPRPPAMLDYAALGASRAPARRVRRGPAHNPTLPIFLAIAAVAVVVVWWMSLSPALTRLVNQRIAVDSDPPGASVLINGRQRGVTPLEVADLAGENVEIWVVRDGFHPWIRKMPLAEAAKTKRIVAHLSPERRVGPPPR